MGRYYSGDIEGKFWFGIQDSDDARHFGGSSCEPDTITYFFDKQDLPDIKAGIKKCLNELGENKKKLDDFFKNCDGYNEKMLAEAGFDIEEIPGLLEEYARLELGEKILKCVEKKGYCEFDAEQ